MLTLSKTSTLGGSSTLEALDLSHTSGLNQFSAVLSRTASKRRTALVFELDQPWRLLLTLLLPLLPRSDSARRVRRN
jgi:hypothetical protein